jgi:hypothetical protein
MVLRGGTVQIAGSSDYCRLSVVGKTLASGSRDNAGRVLTEN